MCPFNRPVELSKSGVIRSGWVVVFFVAYFHHRQMERLRMPILRAFRAPPRLCAPRTYTTPCFITKTGCSVASMLANGLPATATISASFPACNVPILSASPSRSAPPAVPASCACAGVKPLETMSENSRAFMPCVKEAKTRRQIVMVTHNPNLAVVCDAEQVICAEIRKDNGNEVRYISGAIEDP